MFPDTLIFGASGFIGRHLLDHLGPERSIGYYAHTPFPGGRHFDAATMTLDAVLPRDLPIRHAVLFHGITGLDACARDPAGTRRVNVAGMGRLIEDLLDRGIAPAFVSTDAVFDGERGGYGEEDEPAPIIEYGRQKLAVERFIAERRLPVLTIRFSKVVAFTSGTHSLFGEWRADAKAGRPIRCADDQVFSPLVVADAVRLVTGLIATGETGIVHVAGPTAFSRHELYQLFRARTKCLGETMPAAATCSIRDFPFAEARPRNTSLRIERLRALLNPEFTPLSDAIDAALSRECLERRS